jgi:proton glutamate symport protein
MQRMLLFKVFFAALFGAAAGFLLPIDMAVLGVPLLSIYTLFLRALTLIVIPLVAASIISGMMRLGAEQALGRLGGKIAVTFVSAMALAVALGVAAVVILQPGSHMSLPQYVESAAVANTALSGGMWVNIEQILDRIIPVNILQAASQGQILGVISFSLFFGVCASHIPSEGRVTLRAFWEGTFQTLLSMTQVVMRFLPWGVFGLIAKAVATMGSAAVTALGSFSVAVAIALFIYAAVVLPLALWLFAGVSPLKHVQAMFPALVTAFSTSSSAASLPAALECLEKNAGVSNRICGLVLPLGIAVNLCGSALYAAAVVTFLAQLSGVTFTTSTLLTIYLTTLLTSFGMAGIPSASLIVVVLVLQTLQLPSDNLAIIMAVERFADMLRTAVNVFSTSCCAVIVARWEGESTALRWSVS